jgi:hypothetical protein
MGSRESEMKYMKRSLLIACVFVLGAAAGVFSAHVHYVRKLDIKTLDGIRQGLQHQRELAAFSLGILNELEANESDRAKSLLARQAGTYYRTFHDFQPMSPETKRLMQQIEASSESSPALRRAMQPPQQ